MQSTPTRDQTQPPVTTGPCSTQRQQSTRLPPHPLPEELQHCIAEGPGQRPALEVPAQSDVQLHRDEPPSQGVLEQHFTLAESAGQAPLIVVPPEEVHAEASRHTPGVPEGP